MAHQFSVFPFSETRPTIKVPISAERIRKAKAQMAAGNQAGAVEQMRAIRERLERFEKRISNKEEDGKS